MSLSTLLDAARDSAGPRAWTVGVQLARDGAVLGVSDDGDEILCRVKSRGRATPHEVYLWRDDADWGCDCGLPGDCCIHVCAAVIACKSGVKTSGEALPEPKKQFRVSLAYALKGDGNALRVSRSVRWPDGRETALTGPLAQMDVIPDPHDVQIETLLVLLEKPTLDANMTRRLIGLLHGAPHVTLDGTPIRVSRDPLPFQVRVSDHAEGFSSSWFVLPAWTVCFGGGPGRPDPPAHLPRRAHSATAPHARAGRCVRQR